MLSIVEDKKIIRDCQKKLVLEIKKQPDIEEIPDVIIGYPGGNYKTAVLYSKKYDIWMYFGDEENRYWNTFGAGRPETNKNVSPTIEICIPHDGINRKVQGAYAKEGDNVFVIHRGKLGGGREGIGKSLFMKAFSSQMVQINDGNDQGEVFVIGDISSPSFLERLSNFVKETKKIKEPVSLGETDEISQLEHYIKLYAQLKNSKEYDEKYKWEYVKEQENVFADLDNLPDKIQRLTSNVSSYFWKNGGGKYLALKRTNEFKKSLTELFNEEDDLEPRVNSFILSIDTLLKADPDWKNKSLANPGLDTASFLLFLKNPKKYLLFTSLTSYNEFVKFFRLPDNLRDNSNKGRRYVAWMDYCNKQLIPIMDKVTGTKNDMLDCQDFIYCLHEHKIYSNEQGIGRGDAMSKDSIKIDSSNTRNLILYGPPGTGKTYAAPTYASKILFNEEQEMTLEELKDKLRKSSPTGKEPDYGELSWGNTILLIFKGKENEHMSVSEIKNTDYIQGKAKYRGRNKNIHATIWGNLQKDAKLDSKTVNFAKKSNKEYFDKDEKSRWFLTQNGKDALSELISESPTQDESSRIEFVTFHPSFSYEDFVEGFRPSAGEEDSDQGVELRDGIFKKICLKAIQNPTKKYVLIIDEINRANISKVFGELITLIEDDKRLGGNNPIKLRLPYSQEEFGVPSNLYLIGTMNSTDKSIALVDVALRRRFKFERMSPDYEKISDLDARKFLVNLNEQIIAFKGDDFQIGHSYLMGEKGVHLKEAVRDQILPLLEEYFYNDFDRLGTILGKSCIERREIKLIEYDDSKKEPSESGSQYYSILKRDSVQEMIDHVLGKTKPETLPD